MYTTRANALRAYQAYLAQEGKKAADMDKVSFDYDGVLSTEKGKMKAADKIEEGYTVYIISARSSKDGMMATARELGIPSSRVYATGSNKAKVEKIKELGIYEHYDNNPDVVRAVNEFAQGDMIDDSEDDDND